jgi:hypothetical protein
MHEQFEQPAGNTISIDPHNRTLSATVLDERNRQYPEAGSAAAGKQPGDPGRHLAQVCVSSPASPNKAPRRKASALLARWHDEHRRESEGQG